MKHQFSIVPNAEIPRSTFNRSHGYKTTFDAGYLIPFFVDEALPGDTFNVKSTLFARLATPIFPVMDNMYMDTQYFAVPVRLLWTNWERFNGAQQDPGDSTDFLVPQLGSNTFTEGSVFDYMGIPTNVEITSGVSALWNRAYNLIYNDWYRNENLQVSLNVQTDDGPDGIGQYSLQRRGKRHDYFTSCLPWPQKSDSGSVTIPLGSRAPIAHDVGDGIDISVFAAAQDDYRKMDASGPQVAASAVAGIESEALYADLEGATAATINQLRQSFQVQKMFERDARGGTRYTETIRAHFGVTSPDSRLQRPEFLGGGSTQINFTQIPQTSETDVSGPDASPQGNLAAYATATAFGHGFSKSFTEHCVLIGLVSVRADLTYQQGLDRMFSRRTRFDFYWPALSHIGEQAVLNKEIFADGTAADEEVFGYQERHAEYRYKNSKITGAMRSNAAAPLDSWHLSQDFATLPLLNAAFIEETPPVERVIAVIDEPHFIFDSYTQMQTARPMPVYGVPGLIDHF